MLCCLQNYNAKLADFGLAKLGPSGGMSHVTTRVMGTYGYAAPEYIATGRHLFQVKKMCLKSMEAVIIDTRGCKLRIEAGVYLGGY